VEIAEHKAFTQASHECLYFCHERITQASLNSLPLCPAAIPIWAYRSRIFGKPYIESCCSVERKKKRHSEYLSIFTLSRDRTRLPRASFLLARSSPPSSLSARPAPRPHQLGTGLRFESCLQNEQGRAMRGLESFSRDRTRLPRASFLLARFSPPSSLSARPAPRPR